MATRFGGWRMHHAAFDHQQDSRTALSDRHLAHYATAVGAIADRLLRDHESDAHVARVEADFAGGSPERCERNADVSTSTASASTATGPTSTRSLRTQRAAREPAAR
jgi:hypothetical protein